MTAKLRLAQDFPATRCDVAIAGGGMVGLALGIALARAGMQVAVIEKASMDTQLEPGFDGRVSAIAYGSQRILEELGVWRHMAQYAEPILDIRVSDGTTPFFLHYDHREVGDLPFGYIAENRHTRYALWQEAAQLKNNLRILPRTEITAHERDEGSVRLSISDGSQLAASLVVAADGKRSALRSLLGIKALERDYGQTAIVCTIRHTQPHGGLAQERFLPAGPFAVLPMQHNRSSLVWVEPNDRVQLYLELPEDELVQEITERVGDYLGEISLEGPRFAYPLVLMHANTYVAPRAALIGDAAHGIHPIAGQGVNLGFRDVGVLAQLLQERFRLGLDLGAADVLAHYQRWRRFDNVTMLAVTDGLNQLFTTDLIPVKLARGLGMWGVSKLPPLKRLFMRHAMGLVGDLPEVLAGKV
ncbi:MAG: 2-octaprenyl-6-methoxyphenyl hydroxylase [Proteobacteria bacterium]|nr:2-octaprenyl-6-methoxyphenyl hydroxylase [Pseudomonadota bacterium]